MYKENYTQETVKKQRQSLTIHSFDKLNKVINASKRLRAVGYDSYGSLYFNEEEHAYFLVLEDASTKELRYAFLNEYSSTVRSSFAPYIQEHCRCICYNNAVEILGNI